MTSPEYLDYLIENVSENDYVDFKAKFYEKNDRFERVKDIVAFANSHSNEPSRFIIFGVKELNDENKKEFFDIELEDSNEIQQLLQNNVEPDLSVDLYTHIYNGYSLAVIEIVNNNGRPYVIKKSGHGLKQGDIFIRSNSTTKKANRRDLDLMYRNKQNKFNSRNMDINFDSSGSKKAVFRIKSLTRENLPSFKEKKDYEELLIKLQKYNSEETDMENNPLLTKAFAFSSEYFQDKIKIGNDFSGMPIYNSEDDLRKRIENVEEEYEEDDYYYIFKNCTSKMNFEITNNGSAFLNKVLVTIKIPQEIGYIFPQMVSKPKSGLGLLRTSSVTDINNSYPSVENEGEHYIVTEYIERLRHKNSELLFEESLRILFNRNDFNNFTCPYEISAENLTNPIKGNFNIELINNELLKNGE